MLNLFQILDSQKPNNKFMLMILSGRYHHFWYRTILCSYFPTFRRFIPVYSKFSTFSLLSKKGRLGGKVVTVSIFSSIAYLIL